MLLNHSYKLAYVALCCSLRDARASAVSFVAAGALLEHSQVGELPIAATSSWPSSSAWPRRRTRSRRWVTETETTEHRTTGRASSRARSPPALLRPTPAGSGGLPLPPAVLQPVDVEVREARGEQSGKAWRVKKKK
jgi:hypothetical protein